MILLLDTTRAQTVWFALIDKGELFSETTWATNRDLSERLLPELQKFLKRRKLSLDKLEKIAVVVGPGQFSSVRTGVAMANALAFGLNLPVVGLRGERKTEFSDIARDKGLPMVLPYYDREPNISKPKRLKLHKIS